MHVPLGLFFFFLKAPVEAIMTGLTRDVHMWTAELIDRQERRVQSCAPGSWLMASFFFLARVMSQYTRNLHVRSLQGSRLEAQIVA